MSLSELKCPLGIYARGNCNNTRRGLQSEERKGILIGKCTFTSDTFCSTLVEMSLSKLRDEL